MSSKMGERKRSQKISQPPEKKTVGDFLCWLEFTETEQERIASLINSDGLPKQILTKYGPKTYSYSEFRKKESIPGFRGGHEAYNRLAIPKIIEGLQTPSFRNYKFCWRIYREAATKFVIGELEELNRLLENIPYQGEERDAAGMLTLICSNASEFHAKPDAIKTLYEIWWIDRVENFEELLKLCSEINETRVQAKLIGQISERLTKLEDVLRLLSAKVTEQSGTAGDTSEKIEQERNRITKLESSVQNAIAKVVESTSTAGKSRTQLALLSENLEALSEQIEKLNDQVPKKTDIAALQSQIDMLVAESGPDITTTETETELVDSLARTGLEALSESLEALSEQVKKLNEQVTKEPEIAAFQHQIDKLVAENGTIIDIANESATELVDSLATELKAKIEEQAQGLSALTEQIAIKASKANVAPAVVVSGKAPYKSPLSEPIVGAAPSFKITTEPEFLGAWQAMLSQNDNLLIPTELLVAYHSVLLANRVIISDFKVASTWINCLGWSRFVKHVVASPLWSTEEDWQDGVAHLMAEPSGTVREPRYLIIHNYNVAVVDCYLVPTLLLWALRGQKRNVYRKLFLIPAEGKSTIVPSVSEHGAVIERYDSEKRTKLHLLDNMKIPSITRKDIPSGVEPQLASKWAESLSKASFDVGPIEKTFKLKISDWLISGLRDTVGIAGRFFQESSAAGVGIHHHMLPWFGSKLEEAEYNAVHKYCSELPNAEYQ